MLLGIAAIVIGYLLGSTPTAYIVTRIIKGIDIRDVDNGNMGGGAVIRQVGKRAGAFVIIVDVAKGAGAVLIAQYLGLSQPWVLGAGFCSLLGHNFPLYVRFRGGNGVATIMGIFFVLTPVAMGFWLLIIGLVLLFYRHLFSSVAITALFLPLLIWFVDHNLTLIFYALAIIIFVVYRSRRRLVEVKVRTNMVANDIKAVTEKDKEN